MAHLSFRFALKWLVALIVFPFNFQGMASGHSLKCLSSSCQRGEEGVVIILSNHIERRQFLLLAVFEGVMVVMELGRWMVLRGTGGGGGGKLGLLRGK